MGQVLTFISIRKINHYGCHYFELLLYLMSSFECFKRATLFMRKLGHKEFNSLFKVTKNLDSDLDHGQSMLLTNTAVLHS